MWIANDKLLKFRLFFNRNAIVIRVGNYKFTEIICHYGVRNLSSMLSWGLICRSNIQFIPVVFKIVYLCAGRVLSKIARHPCCVFGNSYFVVDSSCSHTCREFHVHVNAQQHIRRTFVLRRKYGENFLDLTSTDLSSWRFILFDWLIWFLITKKVMSLNINFFTGLQTSS